MNMEIAPDQEQWDRIKSRLKKKLGEDVFSSWFARVNLEGHSKSTVNLSVPTQFLKQWIHKNYKETLVDFWKRECDQIDNIDLKVRGATRPQKAKKKPKTVTLPQSECVEAKPISVTANPQIFEKPQKPEPVFLETGHDEIEGSKVYPKFTFKTFVEGKSNSLALAASRQIASSTDVKYNPLYIHASVGLGKTHLLQAIANQANWDGRTVLYLTAETFMYKFVTALQNQSTIAFKDALRNLDLLLIDDMQFLHGKQIQMEFCHTLNSLIDGAKQVICAADRVPMDLGMLDNRMRSRLSGGLVVEIESPDFELRRAILENRSNRINRENPNFGLSEEVINYVAGLVTTNGRDLEGAINRLAAHTQFTGERITMEVAEKALRDLVSKEAAKQINIEDIQKIVSKHYSLTRTELLSLRRNQTVVRPRQIAMYLSKTMTARSLPEIGKRFGNRDHTTVLHAVKKVESMISNDTRMAREIDLLKQMLNS